MLTAYKNDQIGNTYTDLNGDTVNYPEAGELRLGDTAAYLGHQPYNQDDTQTSMPAQDEVISKGVACDICGVPVKSRAHLIKSDGYMRCSDCIDEEGYKHE